MSKDSNDGVYGGCAHVDRGRTLGSEASLDELELEFPSPSSSKSDETDGARKVPLLRGDLKGETWIR